MCMKEMNLNYVHEGDEVGTKLAHFFFLRSFTKFHTGSHTKMSFLRASSVAHSDVTMVSPEVTMVPPGATETPSPRKKLRGAMFDAPGTVLRQSSTVSAPPRSAFTLVPQATAAPPKERSAAPTAASKATAQATAQETGVALHGNEGSFGAFGAFGTREDAINLLSSDLHYTAGVVGGCGAYDDEVLPAAEAWADKVVEEAHEQGKNAVFFHGGNKSAPLGKGVVASGCARWFNEYVIGKVGVISVNLVSKDMIEAGDVDDLVDSNIKVFIVADTMGERRALIGAKGAEAARVLVYSGGPMTAEEVGHMAAAGINPDNLTGVSCGFAKSCAAKAGNTAVVKLLEPYC